MKLATLQNQFAKALHYQALGDDCDIASDQFTADERMQIYRNNFIISLSEVLSATYPMVEALLGETCFAQIARQHVLTHPLQEGSVIHYGKDFHLTVMLFGQVMAQAPYSPEVALFEWNIDLARQARYEHQADTAVQPLTELPHVPESQHSHLVFHLRPGCKCFDAHYAVFDLFAAVRTQQFDQLNINQLQQGVIRIEPDGEAQCFALDAEAYQLLASLEQKQCLSDIPEPLLAHLNHIMTLDLIEGFTLQTA
ncbi:putative DNA-binding domain-containing protein [Vibrio parahaemolyticus]|uniref:HvfC/BufC N-terminal domain-containing protein n=1 Tax=Vibrio parahaemolyticus TaxID=670 RepID=UPI0011219C13|nr:DNA-binding domain-containing protein [Vibrio parahaemolyticus]EHK0035463.1 putative DNA-binding domain-containing protein [Vibrio parahaemolyticus]TOQ84590.1 DUF2063 domain-containing protein [Vibrio parahaemolyticus]